MNMAEHSNQDHSAPHGASRASNSYPSSSPGASAVSQLSPALSSRSCLIQMSQHRLASSGRALVAVLALGLVIESSLSANADPSISPRMSSQYRRLSQPTKATISDISISGRITTPRAPRANLMPRSTVFAAPLFPTGDTPRVSVTEVPVTLATKDMVTKSGGAKIIRIAKVLPGEGGLGDGTASALAPSLPAPSLPTSPAFSTAPPVQGMKKVINVPSLSLPPLSKPLPVWMQSAAVKVDRLENKSANSTRFAQNPAAPPVRNPGTPVTSSDHLANQIEVAVSTFVVLLTTTDLQTVAVADPAIADVAVVNSRSVLLNGKSAGVTSLVIVDGQKIRQYTVRVTAAPGQRPVDVAAAIGLPGVSVRPLKDALVLEGEVASAEEAKQAVDIAGIYSAKVVNQLTIRGQVSKEAGAAAQLRDLINLPNVNVRVSGDTAILTGTVDTPQQVQDADTIARTSSKNVINLLKLPPMTVDQIRQSLGAVADVPVGSDVTGQVAPGVFAAPSPLVIQEAGGSLVLQGTVPSQAALDQILTMANRSGLPIVNRLIVPAAQTPDQVVLSGVAAAIGRPGVRVSGSAKRLVLEGVVPDTEAAVAAEQIARAFSSQVDNLLQTSNPRLVDIDVSIVEVTKSGLENLGFQIPSLFDSDNTGFVIGQRSINLAAPGALTPGAVSQNRLPGAIQAQTAFQAQLRAQIQNQNARLLSNPHTTVLSGRTATFQSGGQVPVPVSITQSATGTITGISFKDYGILVDVVPNASANGAVTMRIKTEISSIDPTTGFTPFAGASVIPGFLRRATETEVTTPAGGTLALGGLISHNTRKLVQAIPVLSKLPILGSLFTSKRFQNDETELIIFVTPKVLPNPLPEGQTAAAGVVAVGNTSNVATVLGNPGLSTGGIGVVGAASP